MSWSPCGGLHSLAIIFGFSSWIPRDPHKDPQPQRFILIYFGNSVFKVLSVSLLFLLAPISESESKSEQVNCSGRCARGLTWRNQWNPLSLSGQRSLIWDHPVSDPIRFICNYESKASGDKVALLKGFHPICMVFGLVEAKSLGSQQTGPYGTHRCLFWDLCLTVVFVSLVCSVFVSLLMTDLSGQTMGTTPRGIFSWKG